MNFDCIPNQALKSFRKLREPFRIISRSEFKNLLKIGKNSSAMWACDIQDLMFIICSISNNKLRHESGINFRSIQISS